MLAEKALAFWSARLVKAVLSDLELFQHCIGTYPAFISTSHIVFFDSHGLDALSASDVKIISNTVKGNASSQVATIAPAPSPSERATVTKALQLLKQHSQAEATSDGVKKYHPVSTAHNKRPRS